MLKNAKESKLTLHSTHWGRARQCPRWKRLRSRPRQTPFACPVAETNHRLGQKSWRPTKETQSSFTLHTCSYIFQVFLRPFKGLCSPEASSTCSNYIHHYMSHYSRLSIQWSRGRQNAFNLFLREGGRSTAAWKALDAKEKARYQVRARKLDKEQETLG